MVDIPLKVDHLSRLFPRVLFFIFLPLPPAFFIFSFFLFLFPFFLFPHFFLSLSPSFSFHSSHDRECEINRSRRLAKYRGWKNNYASAGNGTSKKPCAEFVTSLFAEQFIAGSQSKTFTRTKPRIFTVNLLIYTLIQL